MALTFDRNFWLRVFSALSALPLVFGSLYLGGIWFLLFGSFCSYLLLREYFRLVGLQSSTIAMTAFPLLAVLPCVLVFAASEANYRSLSTLQLTLGFAALGITISILSLWVKETASKLLWLLCGFFYVGMISGSLVWLSYLSKMLVVWLLFSVWASDVGGYFAGRLFGGPKLAPSISPKKTWSGAIGGLLLAAGIGAFISYVATWWNPVIAAVASVAIAIISQLGDLHESALKRRFDVKDSGSLLPGHGGLMDRVDGLAFAAAATVLYETSVILRTVST